MKRPLKFAVIGTGFWANYQIAAWKELQGTELVALYNRTRAKAETLAKTYGVANVYDNIDDLLNSESLDFVDIITDVDTHAQFTEAAASRGVSVICQKPMAPKLDVAKRMLDVCKKNGVDFYIHENWRWQSPIRELKKQMDNGTIGNIFKARVTFCSAFPVFENQPFLAELDEFILTDIGCHILDVCRFLFGEVDTLQAHTSTVNKKIKGEDVANVFMRMQNGISCFAEMSYASILENESFPQTFILVEGEHGSLHLTRDYQVLLTTRKGTEKINATPTMYSWLDPKYALVHSSIVACNRDILGSLQKEANAETTGADNFETVKLVHAAYASARERRIIEMKSFA